MLAVGLCALLAGIVGYTLVRAGAVTLGGDVAREIHPSAHARFYAVVCAHWADYIVGFIGAAVLTCWVWLKRPRASQDRPRAELAPSPVT